MDADEILVAVRLYEPFIGVLLAGLAIWFVKARIRAAGTVLESEVQISLGVIVLPIKLKRSWLAYGFLSCVAIWSASTLFTRNYSSFFPSKLKLEVFYDRAGIENTLAALQPLDRVGISTAPNWWAVRAVYYLDLDHEAAPGLQGASTFFRDADAAVHSRGEMSFVVKKGRGWQNYHIEKSSGEVLHTLELPDQPQRTLLTSFEKLDTASDYLRPTFYDLVVRRSILMRPRFKQYLSAKRAVAGTPFKVTIIGVTSVRIFPLPDFSNTLYLADVPGTGHVPIAYAVYATGGSEVSE